MVTFLVPTVCVFAVALVSLLAREALNSMAAWAEKMRLSYAAATDTVPHLIELLSHENAKVVRNAAEAIANSCDGDRANQDAAADAVPRLIALLSQENVGVVYITALAIGKV